MERKQFSILAILVAVVSAVAAYFLRSHQLQTMLDEAGKFLQGAGKGPLTWVCVAFGVLALVYSLMLKKSSTCVVNSTLTTITTLLAAFAMAVGSAAELHRSAVIAVGGLIAAVCWVVVALQRQQGTQPSAGLFMLPALFYAVDLIIEFRDWSRDPLILDYCFQLLSSIFVMCATYHLGGFSLGRGKRRITIFYCLCGIVVSAAAMVGEGLGGMLKTGAAMLWLLGNLWLLQLPAPAEKAAAIEEILAEQTQDGI